MSGNKVVLRTQAKNGPEILKINTIIMQQQVDCKSFQKPENIFRKMQKKKREKKMLRLTSWVRWRLDVVANNENENERKLER